MRSQKSQTSAFRSQWSTSSSPSNCSLFLLWCLTANESIFFSSTRTEDVGCGSASSQNWTEPSANLPPLSLWLSDHLFAVICPFSRDAEKKAILEAPTEFHQHGAESHRHTKEQRETCPPVHKPCCVWPQLLGKQFWTVFLNSMVFIFAVFLLSVQTNSHG